MDRLTDDCGIRRAHVRFGLVYWAGIFLASLPAAVLGSGASGAPGVDVRSVVATLALDGACWLGACAISLALLGIHGRATRNGSTEGALPALLLSSFALSLLGGIARAGLGRVLGGGGLPTSVGGADWAGFVNDTALGAALFFGWCALFVALVFAFELHARSLRLAAVREEALAAQMRALRYQVNPHFMFNTLNSIAGLIEEGSSARAGRMVLSLSTFLRTTLALDPVHDVPLAEELALQRDYLEIERERFSDRMTFRIDAADDVRRALVPSLILQPLIENAVKHGVGATAGQVEIALRARRDADRLLITIENDMPIDGGRPGRDGLAGMGVGTRNVAERLRARFRDDGLFAAGPVGPGRFRASLA
ncbi:sensor histidine kinase, partial [Oharaeibacter diazotrophicus]